VLLPVLRTDETGFEAAFAALQERRNAAQGLAPEQADSVRRSVEDIIAAVRERGDAAVIEYTERFDGCKLAPDGLRVSEKEITEALRAVPEALLDALKLAAERIRAFQEAILLRDPAPLTVGGRTLGLRYRPVDSAGVCVPGASASLASSVLMSIVPAVAAGVGRIVMVTPPGSDGSVSADRLAAARIAGAHEIYRVFGVQALAALAFGTESIPRVDFIAGPGNVYVAAAKKALFGQVGIDMIAGPSEVVILADGRARPAWVAAEMLSQSEHTSGSATLITDSEPLAAAAAQAAEKQLASLAKAADVRRCLSELGAAIIARSLDECAEVTNRIAPEHLVIMTEDPDAVCAQVRHAGAVFLGDYAPVAAGDYVAGPSHCLPTGRTARFSSCLTANAFLKSTSLISYDRAALEEDAEAIARIAEAEGLEAHKRSTEIRSEDEPDGD